MNLLLLSIYYSVTTSALEICNDQLLQDPLFFWLKRLTKLVGKQCKNDVTQNRKKCPAQLNVNLMCVNKLFKNYEQ